MDDFLTKPVDKGLLKAAIEKYLGITEQSSSEKKIENSAEHFNKNMLLNKIEGDEEVYLDLVETTLIKVPEYITMIYKSIEEMDAVKIKNRAHALKGTALTMCLNKLAKLSEEIEEESSKTEEEVFKIYRKIEIEWELIKKLF